MSYIKMHKPLLLSPYTWLNPGLRPALAELTHALFLHINQTQSPTVLYRLSFNVHWYSLQYFSLISSAHTYCAKDSADINPTSLHNT